MTTHPFNLRYYQREAFDAVHREWETHQSTAAVMATGSGKTELYLALATEFSGRALVLVHRDYLITSPVARLAAVGFSDVAVEKADRRAEAGGRRAQIVFASVQSIGPDSQRHRLLTFDPADFDLVIIDEGHRAVSRSYQNVLRHFRANRRLKVLILTATPKRKDGVSLRRAADSVAYEYSPAQAAVDGWTVPLRFVRRQVSGLDFSGVKLKGADFDADQLNDLLIQEGPLHEVCSSLADDRGPTIVFCPKVAVARAYTELMNHRYRPGRAACLHAGSDDDERDRGVRGLADGTLDYVFQVDLFTEGFDLPHLERVVWAAPTASLVKWTQGCGRVFRVHADVARRLSGGREGAAVRRRLIEGSAKPFGTIVTYYGQNCRHAICTPTDILGGKDVPPAVAKAAKQIEDMTAGGDGSDPAADLETGEILVRLQEIVDRRRREIKAKATVRDVEFDGQGGGTRSRVAAKSTRDVLAAAESAAASWGPGEPATPKQLGLLRIKGLSAAADMGLTKLRASLIIDLAGYGVGVETGAGYGRKQAFAVRDSYQARKEYARDAG